MSWSSVEVGGRHRGAASFTRDAEDEAHLSVYGWVMLTGRHRKSVFDLGEMLRHVYGDAFVDGDEGNVFAS